MIRRTLEAARFNEIANHPDVRPWLGGEGPLDLAGLVTNPANISLIGEHGGFIGHKLDQGLYEVHSLFLLDGRGGEAVEAMRAGARFMFCATDCMELVTKCPADNAAALGLARVAGFQEVFKREQAWPVEGGPVTVSYQSLSFSRWKARDPEIASMGEWFHHKLETAKSAAGSLLLPHPHDEAHERAVGAAIAMIRHGNPRKGVWTYNRWAIFAGYAPIELVSETPLLIDVVDAVLTKQGEDMEVVLCR